MPKVTVNSKKKFSFYSLNALVEQYSKEHNAKKTGNKKSGSKSLNLNK